MEGRIRRGSSRGRGRSGRGGGRKYSELKKRPVLPSNADRYEEGTEAADPDLPVPNSQGEDLEALLNNLKLTEWSAYSHYRSLVADLNSEPPLATDGSQPKELSLDTTALAASLSLLPLEHVIGIEPKYLQSVQKFCTQPQKVDKDGMHKSIPMSANMAISTNDPKTVMALTDTKPTAKFVEPPQPQIRNNDTFRSPVPLSSKGGDVKLSESAILDKKVDNDDDNDLDSLLELKPKDKVPVEEKFGRLKKSRHPSGDEDDLDALLDMSRGKAQGGSTKGNGGDTLESWMDDL